MKKWESQLLSLPTAGRDKGRRAALAQRHPGRTEKLGQCWDAANTCCVCALFLSEKSVKKNSPLLPLQQDRTVTDTPVPAL